jgi:hypothetical protein
MNHPDPRGVYEARLGTSEAAAANLQRRDDLFASLRAATFVGGLALVAAAAWWEPARPLWGPLLALPFVAFVVFVYLHDRVARERARINRVITFYKHGIARIDYKWIGLGNPGNAFIDPEHPYAVDFDLFGRASLFELLCTARTVAGEHTLANWLLKAADVNTLQRRHEALNDLRGRLQLREDLALLTESLRADVHPDRVAQWGSAPILLEGRAVRMAAALLALLNLATLLCWLLGAWSAAPLLLSTALSFLLRIPIARRMGSVWMAIKDHDRELLQVGQVAQRFLDERFESVYSKDLQHNLTAEGISAPKQIRNFERLVRLLDQYRNQFFVPIGFLLLWDVQLIYAIESWRAKAGYRIGAWLEAIGEAEAMIALATYAYEHPRDPLPELVQSQDALFDGEQLAHPLLAEDVAVPNDVSLANGLRVLVVSGSNMSGKSTLLRTVGVNAVLALAGGPVRAKRLQLVPLAIGATLRVQDSLLGGTSRFYAEIRRLKQIVDLTQLPPGQHVLFLLDEIMHGTNSHDRLIGASAIVRALVQQGAIGLVTTHDLALAEVVSVLGDRAANVHFEDQLIDAKLSFDYRMRPGVVQRSNAIALMRSVGLDVGEEGEGRGSEG